MTNDIRKHSSQVLDGMERAPSRAMLYPVGFKPEDFARLHPGGTLGKRLLWTVADLMHKGKENPVVGENDSVRKALDVIHRLSDRIQLGS